MAPVLFHRRLAAGRKAETASHTASDGPPLVARVFATPVDGVAERYAAEVVAALESLRTQLHGIRTLDDRVAIVCPDDTFLEELRAPLTAALEAAGSFELVAAAQASATLPTSCGDSFSGLTHDGAVMSVAVFPSGDRVVSGSDDKTVKLWDAASGKCLATWGDSWGRHSGAVMSVAVFPLGDRVVSGSHDKTVKLWDAALGKCLATWEGHSGPVVSVAVFPWGARVVSGSGDNTLKVWNAATGDCLATWGEPRVVPEYERERSDQVVNCVAVFPSGGRVVSGSGDETLRLWGPLLASEIDVVDAGCAADDDSQ